MAADANVLYRARAHVCRACRRPVERAAIRRHPRGYSVDVYCHGDAQSALVTENELETGVYRWYWFAPAPEPAQRIDLHLFVHYEETK